MPGSRELFLGTSQKRREKKGELVYCRPLFRSHFTSNQPEGSLANQSQAAAISEDPVHCSRDGLYDRAKNFTKADRSLLSRNANRYFLTIVFDTISSIDACRIGGSHPGLFLPVHD
jgi:hypothetical protein